MGSVALVIVLVAVGMTQSNAARSDRFWGLIAYQFMEAESFDSLDGMRAGADAVVLGRIISLTPGRVWGNPPSDAAWYATAIVQVDQVFAGRLVQPGPTIQLELFMAEPQVFDSLAATIPFGEEAVYFLRNKGAEAAFLGRSMESQVTESQYYRLVTSKALIRHQGTVALAAVAAAEPFLRNVDGVPWDGVLEALRSGSSLDSVRE